MKYQVAAQQNSKHLKVAFHCTGPDCKVKDPDLTKRVAKLTLKVREGEMRSILLFHLLPSRDCLIANVLF